MLWHIVTNAGERPPRPDGVLMRGMFPLNSHVANSRHQVVLSRGAAWCSACMQGTQASDKVGILRWMYSPCPGFAALPERISSAHCFPRPFPVNTRYCIYFAGRRIHPSHRLWCYRKLFFCIGCGKVAAHRVKDLNLPCLRHTTTSSARSLNAIWQLRLPHGTPCWPDGLHTPYRIARIIA